MMSPACELLPDFFRQPQHLQQRSPVAQRTFTGALDHRAVRHRIAERNAELDDVRARINRGESDVARGREIGIAASEIGDERWLMLERKGHGIGTAACLAQSNFRFSRKIPMSLSPRPEMFTITTSDFFILGARLITSATA